MAHFHAPTALGIRGLTAACLFLAATVSVHAGEVAGDARFGGFNSQAESVSESERTFEEAATGTPAQSVSCPRCGKPHGVCPESNLPGQSPTGNGQPPLSQSPRTTLAPEQYAGLGGNAFSVNDAPGGYLENPIVASWFRARYDVAVNNMNPDIAEYFSAKPRNLGGPGPLSPTGFNPSSVNYQVGSLYGELLLAPRLSVFAELQIQRTDLFYPTGLPTPSTIIQNGGLGDTIAGFKYLLHADECQYLTLQFKTYAPTGDASRGLGTHHVSLEPGFLYLNRLSNRAYFQGQVQYWTPIGGTDFAGNMIDYGMGMGYDLIRSYDGASPLNPYVAPGLRVTAVLEYAGYTFLSGQKTQRGLSFSDPNITESAFRWTIGNVKPGVRFTYGLDSIYAGASIPVTGNRFYSDLFRVEYRHMF